MLEYTSSMLSRFIHFWKLYNKKIDTKKKDSPPKNDTIYWHRPNLYDFLLWSIKDGILQNAGNQTVSVPINFYYISSLYNGREREPKLFALPKSYKYLNLCSAYERNV